MSSRNEKFEEKAAAMKMQKRKHGGTSLRKISKSCQSESASSSEIKPVNDVTSSVKSTSAGKSGDKRSSKRLAENVLVARKKRQKKMVTSDSDSVAGGGLSLKDLSLQTNSRREIEDNSSSQKAKSSSKKSRKKDSSVLDFDKSLQEEAISGASNESESNQPVTSSGDTLKKEEFVDENIYKQEVIDNKGWKPFEKALYEKGIQIFGRNRFDFTYYLLVLLCYYVLYLKLTFINNAVTILSSHI